MDVGRCDVLSGPPPPSENHLVGGGGFQAGVASGCPPPAWLPINVIKSRWTDEGQPHTCTRAHAYMCVNHRSAVGGGVREEMRLAVALLGEKMAPGETFMALLRFRLGPPRLGLDPGSWSHLGFSGTSLETRSIVSEVLGGSGVGSARDPWR